MKLFTIGFTKKSAETFFTRLQSAGVQRLVDVRLNNVSQHADFAKKNDLAYFAKTICNIDYVHMPSLAPTADILDAYKKHKGDWGLYERQFLTLMETRKIEHTSPLKLVDGACLLCSEENLTTATAGSSLNISGNTGALSTSNTFPNPHIAISGPERLRCGRPQESHLPKGRPAGISQVQYRILQDLS